MFGARMFIKQTTIILILLGSLIGSLLTITYKQHFVRTEAGEIQPLTETRGNVTSHNTPEYDDASLAAELYHNVSVLCWVMTYPENHFTKAVHTQQTWGKRCDKFIYMSDTADPEIGSIGLNSTPGRGHLASKSREALDYLYRHHLDDADWFLKADDDTYVIMENLRFLLRNVNPNDAIFFGTEFRHDKFGAYVSGGAGYVISRRALIGFADREPDACVIDRWDGSSEDVYLSCCLRGTGAHLGSSLDTRGRSRFHHFSPLMHLAGDFPRWYPKRSSNPPTSGLDALSDSAISFHKVEAVFMYILEYFIYHLRPYGVIHGQHRREGEEDLNDRFPLPEMPEAWRHYPIDEQKEKLQLDPVQ